MRAVAAALLRRLWSSSRSFRIGHRVPVRTMKGRPPSARIKQCTLLAVPKRLASIIGNRLDGMSWYRRSQLTSGVASSSARITCVWMNEQDGVPSAAQLALDIDTARTGTTSTMYCSTVWAYRYRYRSRY